jgi:hypothetical protein
MTLFHPWQHWSEVADQSPQFVIEDLVHSSSTIVSGRPMSGKTTLVAAMVAAIAGEDTDFLGQKVEVHGDVLVACTDGGETSAWGRRMRNFDLKHQVEVARYDPVRIWDEAVLIAETRQPALFVFDNVLGATTGDIRDNASARLLLGRFDQIIATGTPVLAVAHSSARQFEDGTYNKGPMGSTAYDAWDRLTVHVEPSGKNSVLISAKGNESPPIELRVDVEMGDDLSATYSLLSSDKVSDKRPRQLETQDNRVVEAHELIIGNPALRGIGTMRGVEEALGVNYSKVRRIIRASGAVFDGNMWVLGQTGETAA